MLGKLYLAGKEVPRDEEKAAYWLTQSTEQGNQYAKTQKALLDKLHQNIECYRDVELTEGSRMILGQWLDRWLTEYKAGTVRPGTLEATAATSNTTSSRSWATSRSPSSPSRTSSGCTAA